MKYRELKQICYPKSKSAYDNKLIFVFFVRKISIFFTYLFIKLGIGANQTTLLSILSGLGGCYLLSFGDYKLSIYGAVLINAWMLFDCMDGEIARYRGPSELGASLEVLNSDLMYAALLPSIAVGVFRYSGQHLIIVVAGFSGAISYLLFRGMKPSRKEASSRLEAFLLAQFKGNQGDAPRLGTFFYFLRMNLLSQGGIWHPLVLVLAVLDRLSHLVMVYSSAYILQYIVTVLGFIVYKSLHSRVT